MAFKKKDNKPRGTFVSRKDEETLKKAQKLRLVFMYSSTLTLALILFVPQEWAEFTKNVLWLQTSYVLLIFALIVVSVVTSFCASRGCNVTKPIDERRRPKKGFENRTFVSVELFSALHTLHAAAQIALFIYGVISYGFDIRDFVAALLSCGGAIFAYLFHRITFITLKDDLIYLPPAQTENLPQDGGEKNGGAENNGDGAANDNSETK